VPSPTEAFVLNRAGAPPAVLSEYQEGHYYVLTQGDWEIPGPVMSTVTEQIETAADATWWLCFFLVNSGSMDPSNLWPSHGVPGRQAFATHLRPSVPIIFRIAGETFQGSSTMSIDEIYQAAQVIVDGKTISVVLRGISIASVELTRTVIGEER